MIIDELFESPQQCPECGGISFSDLILAEKKDACYHKVKASAKVWPSAYASGRLVQCRKKGAANYGNKSEGVSEGSEQISEYRDRLLQYVKSLLPTWPEYVLKDWLVPNKGNFSNLPADAVKNGIMEKIQLANLSVNTKWQLVPNMKFTMGMFEPMSKQRLIGRAGGNSDMGLDVPRDKERHATQAALAQQQGGVRKEPVLLIKTDKGYELLEGWHRTIQHFAKYPDGYTGPAYVAVAQQGVAETVATPPAPAQDPSQPYLDKLGARVGVAPGSNITQVTDAYQQKLLDRMGKRFGLPPGSTMDQVQAAQQAYLNKNDPTAAAQYKQNMTNIDAGNTAANKPVQLAPKPAPARPVAENTAPQLSVQQLATISDEALDNAYGYGRSTPGNTFGWQANLKSAAYAKQMIDQGVTDIEAISDAIHKGWNTTAQAFVQDPEQFDDTAKLAAAGKLEAKLQQRAQLMKQNYAQLPEEEKEKDRVVARALLQAIRGEQGVAEGQLELNTPDPVVVVQDLKGNILDKINLSVAAQKYKLGQPQNIKNQLAHQNYTKVGNYTIVSPMSGQPQDQTTIGQKSTFATTEGEQQKGADYRDPKEVDYNDEYDAMVARVKKLAGLGPMKTTYDPAKRQYRNMPTAQQPKK